MGQITPDGVTEREMNPQESPPAVDFDIAPDPIMNEFFSSLNGAVQQDAAAEEAVDLLINEIQKTTGLFTDSPDMQVQASSRMEQLNTAIQDSNMPEDIKSSFNNIYTTSIDNPQYLNVLNGFIMQGGGSISGIAGAAQRLNDEAIEKRNKENSSRAATATAAAIAQSANKYEFDPQIIDDAAQLMWENSSNAYKAKMLNISERMFDPSATPEEKQEAIEDGANAVSTEMATSSDENVRRLMSEMDSYEEKAAYVIELSIETSIDLQIEKDLKQNPSMSAEDQEKRRADLRENIAPEIEALKNDPERMERLMARVERDEALASNGNDYTNTNILRLGLAAYMAITGDTIDGLENFSSEDFYQNQREFVQANLDKAKQDLENIKQSQEQTGSQSSHFSSYILYQAQEQVETMELNLEVISLQENTENSIKDHIQANGGTLSENNLRDIMLDIDPALFAKSAELSRRTGNESHDTSNILTPLIQNMASDQAKELDGFMNFAAEVSAAKIDLYNTQEWKNTELQKLENATINDLDSLGADTQKIMNTLSLAMEEEKAALNKLAALRLGVDENSLPEFAFAEEAVLQKLSLETTIDQTEINNILTGLGLDGDELAEVNSQITQRLTSQHNIEITQTEDAPAPAPEEPSAMDIRAAEIAQQLAAMDSVSRANLEEIVYNDNWMGPMHNQMVEKVEAQLTAQNPDFKFADMDMDDQIVLAFIQNDGTLTQQDIELIVSENGIEGPGFKTAVDELTEKYSNHPSYHIDPPVQSAAAEYQPVTADAPDAAQPPEQAPEDQSPAPNGQEDYAYNTDANRPLAPPV